MNKENRPEFSNINNSQHSREKVPYITISNSKSNSSKNQNSKTSSNKNKLILTQTSNNLSSNRSKDHQDSSFHIIRKKLLRNTNIGKLNGILTFTEISINQNVSNISFTIPKKTNRVLSEGNRGIKILKVLDIETPKKPSDKNIIFHEELKNNKKALLSIENINGKNLMDYFEKLYVNVTIDGKNMNRVPSVENIQNSTIKLNKNTVDTNKSWNKNNRSNCQIKSVQFFNKYNKNFGNKNGINYKNIKKEINISRCPSNNNKKIVDSLNILFKKDNEYIENLINKFRPKVN